LLVASKQREIGDIEANERGKQTPIGFGDRPAEQVALARQSRVEFVEGSEQRIVGGFVGGLRLGEAAAVDAVVDVGIAHLIEAIDLGAHGLGIKLRAVARDALEFAVEHADDFGGLVVDDAPGLAVPQRRDRDLAGVTGVACGVGLVQIAEAVDAIGGAIREGRIVLEGPALLPQSGDRIGDRDRAFELLDRAIDQRAMCPWAAIRDVEVIAPRFGLEPGRPIRRDAVPEAAVRALELAAGAGFLRQLAVAPRTFDQNAHYAASPPASAAALRMAAMLAR